VWLLTEACKDAQLWHDILEACNQKLESSKCKCHAIHFNFDEEGAPTMALGEVSPYHIVVTDGEGHQLEMKHQPSNGGDQAPRVRQSTRQQPSTAASHHGQV